MAARAEPRDDRRRAGTYWPTADQELLLRAALLRPPAAIEAWRALRPRFRPERVEHAGQAVLPLLGDNLRRHGIDDPALPALAAARERAAARNRELFAAGRGLLGALADAAIPTLVLKGGALALAYYGDPGLRPMTDLDVLVPTDRVPDAIAVLGTAGWVPKTTAVSASAVATQHARSFVDHARHNCDLHWHVYWECCAPGADDELWRASVPLEFEGVPSRMLGAADLLLHLCVHGSRRARRPVLRWIPDAVTVLRAGGIDWPRLVAEAAGRRVALRVRTMLAYLARAFGAPVDGHALERLAAVPVSWLERVEFRVGIQRQGVLGELPGYWVNYRRLRAGRSAASTPGFARYLQEIWEVPSLRQVAGAAAARAAGRLHGVLRRRGPGAAR